MVFKTSTRDLIDKLILVRVISKFSEHNINNLKNNIAF